MPWLLRPALEEKHLSLICTQLGDGLALVLKREKLRLRELGKVRTETPSDILNYDPGQKIGVFGEFGEVLLGVLGEKTSPGLTEGKGQPGCWAFPFP